MKKFLVLFCGLCFCLGILTACGGADTADTEDNSIEQQVNSDIEPSNEIDGKPVGEYLSEKYPLESDEVNIYIYGTYYPTTITDPEAIRLLQDSVNFDSWEYVAPGSGLELLGGEHFYVQFNDQTTIAMYYETPYGYMGQGAPSEDLFNLENSEAYFNMNEEFFQTVIELNEKYRNK